MVPPPGSLQRIPENVRRVVQDRKKEGSQIVNKTKRLIRYAVVDRRRRMRTEADGTPALYMRRREAKADSFPNDRVARVEIREIR